MSVSVIRGTNDKPVASRSLEQLIRASRGLTGKLFIGYPIVGTHEGPRRIDALLVSEDRGLIVFDLVEGRDIEGSEDRQDDAANTLEAKLRAHRGLVRRRRLRVPIHTVSFAPAISGRQPRAEDDDYPVANRDSLAGVLERFTWQRKDKYVFETALSALEHISTIRKVGTPRPRTRDDSRSAKLRRMEDSVATLDTMQSKAVIETVNGVQRIRGLAGSGKTIVLALKAAYLHAQHPGWRIAVTFYTRSLKQYFSRLIKDFYVAQTNETPDWNNLHVRNAWGAPGGDGRDGIYHHFCRIRGSQYHDFTTAKRRFGADQAFAGVCRRALEESVRNEQCYDAVLVDEAQDIPPVFLRLCYELLKPPKRMVYAYDELQNLGQRPLPPPDEIFGRAVRRNDDTPHDIILDKCYRNSRPVLVTAHALGFGVYRESSSPDETGLVQMFDDPKLWEEVGYRVKEGALREGSVASLERTSETSPIFLEDHSALDDLVQFRCFDNSMQQAEWVAERIERDLGEEDLRPDDIIVINPDPATAVEQTGPIRALLADRGIQNHLAGISISPDVFSQRDSVTFAGIHRAKGNEAGMVYVINAHGCFYADYNLASVRNRLFSAITRSKAWIRVCGVGDGMRKLAREYEKLKDADFELRFRYPTSEQLEHLRIVHREISTEERKRVQDHRAHLSQLIDDLQAGEIYAEDIGGDMSAKLRQLLAVREGRRSRGDS